MGERSPLTTMSVSRWRRTIGLGWLLFLRDFNYRFRQAFFGYFWAFLRPLLMGVSLIVVGQKLNTEEFTGPTPFAAFTFSGMILLQIFWDGVVFPQWITRRARSILRRNPIQNEALLVAAACYALFNVAVYLVLLFAMAFFLEAPLAATTPLAIACIPLVLLAGLAVGTYLAPITLIFLDVRYSIPVVFPVLLVLTPILYRMPTSADDGILYYVTRYNPVAHLVDAPRAWFFGEVGVATGTGVAFILSLGFFVAVGAVGVWFFRRGMPTATDQL